MSWASRRGRSAWGKVRTGPETARFSRKARSQRPYPPLAMGTRLRSGLAIWGATPSAAHPASWVAYPSSVSSLRRNGPGLPRTQAKTASPCALAWYMRLSAAERSSSGVLPSSGKAARPMFTPRQSPPKQRASMARA